MTAEVDRLEDQHTERADQTRLHGDDLTTGRQMIEWCPKCHTTYVPASRLDADICPHCADQRDIEAETLSELWQRDWPTTNY